MLDSAERSIDEVLEQIQVPPSKYDAANRAFISICEWLSREASCLKKYDPQTSLQGSFRLGTAIKPLTDDDDYDVDIVCTMLALKKSDITPSDLKRDVGTEVKAYAKKHSMTRPIDGRRCWTQEYADGSQFHVDVLPSIQDSVRQRELLEASKVSTAWVETAIAITDKTDPNFHVKTERWPLSNPSGYASWFESRMAPVLRKRKEAIALNEHASVDSIPTYRAKTPLQSAIQLLKYHRDVMFSDDSDNKPISIIITTLAAQAYNNEVSVFDALVTIIENMDNYIEKRAGIDWVVNPTNPMENFADKWIEYPVRRQNFYDWLATIRSDLSRLNAVETAELRKRIVEESFGVEVANRISDDAGFSLKKLAKSAKLRLLGGVSHRQSPPWTGNLDSNVQIFRAVSIRNGFRPSPFSSDGPSLPKGASLTFYARTDVEPPFDVYWQVVNTGAEASSVTGGLRGGFDKGDVSQGRLAKSETSKYSGSHSIECFVVKNDYLVAKSGQFIVNIK